MEKMRTRKSIVALALGLLLSVVLSAGVVAADSLVVGNVHVEGDPTQPIEGAEVYATCLADNVVRGPVYSDYAGNYLIDLSTTTCTVDDTVSVTGTYGGQSDTNFGTITTLGVSLDLAIVCLDIPIPEFATIAIPVAGILGLVLFFNHRKHKKE